MGAILLGSGGSLPENDESTNAISLPDSLPIDPTVLVDGVGIGVPLHGGHVPAGGLSDQVLTKLSDDDYSMAWEDPAESGSTYTFGNGLTESGGAVRLGGALTQTTLISGVYPFQVHLTGTISLRSSGQQDGLYIGQEGSHWFEANGELSFKTTGGDMILEATQYGKLTFDGTDGNVFTDNRVTKKGIEYDADYSGTFTDRSLVDKAYVDAAIIGTFTFENGLTETTGTVRLGGALTGTTNIDIEDNLFSIYFDDSSYSGKIEIGDSTFSISTWDQELYAGNRFSIHMLGGITLIAHDGTNSIRLDITETSFEIADTVNSKGVVYGGNYSANFTDRSLVDKAYVLSVAGTSLSFGTSDQIPHMNIGGTDFEYTDNFRYHSSGYMDIVKPGAATSYIRAQYNYFTIYVLGTLRTALTPSASDSAIAVAYQFDTSTNFATAGAKLVSVQNNNVEKFFIDKDGSAWFNGSVQVGSMTTTERDALTPANGMIVYNTTTNAFNFRENGTWVTK